MWPEENITYRGTALPKVHQKWFAQGKKFRTPMFVATSGDRSVAERFMGRLSPASAMQSPAFQEPTLWIFHLHPKKRCANVNFIDTTDGTCYGEDEFLFSPYSTFTVKSVEFVANPFGIHDYEKSYHKIHLEVSPDNSEEKLDLPSAPWS